jgi:glycosyltransferase involved in cell wall biosynthesis
MTKLVSIIVPCYNQAQYLDECLQSVLEQTYENWECIVVNDGSPDNTDYIVKIWKEKDSRFKYLYKDNGGLSSARNAGISKANGEFILPLDADDKIASKYCELALQEFEKNQDLRVVYCEAEMFGLEKGILKLGNYSISDLAKKNLIFCSAFFKKRDWGLVGGYDENMIYGLEDWEFWISILKNDGKVFKLDQVCFFYRIKENSMVKELKNERIKRMYDYMSNKHVAFFVEHLGSFKHLLNSYEALESKLKSEKYIINLLSKRILGIKVFKNIQD